DAACVPERRWLPQHHRCRVQDVHDNLAPVKTTMPFDVDSDKVIIEMPVYKPSTEIAFMSELMNKKELTREEKLQLFTVQTLDQIKFNLDNTVLIAMRAHNDIVKLRADVRALQAESDTP